MAHLWVMKLTSRCMLTDAGTSEWVIYEPWESLIMQYANKKGTDQPVWMRCLISTFVVHCLDSNTPSNYTRNFKSLARLCSWAGWFESYLVANPEDRFSRDVAHIIGLEKPIKHHIVNGGQSHGMNIMQQHDLSPVKRICVFEHSVMTNFNCACPAIQRGQGSGFLSEGSSWLTAYMSEQRRFWRACADAQARLNLRCSHRR